MRKEYEKITEDVLTVIWQLVGEEYSLADALTFRDILTEKINEVSEIAPRRISLKDGISEVEELFPNDFVLTSARE